jgi:hypothetical protein
MEFNSAEKQASILTVRDRVLTALQSGPQTTLQLHQIAPEATRRLRELRAAGYNITKESVGSIFIYTLQPFSFAASV